MSLKIQTIETYNTSADALAKKFDDLGARTEDINYVFSLCEKKNPFVLEIGCGNGRDAVEICKRTNNYEGIDVSEKLIDIAKMNLPTAHLTVADIEEFTFPPNLDIVFAFASLIHVPKESFKKIMAELFTSMEKHGLVFISLKHSTSYEQVTKNDEFGVRTYWHYSPSDLEEVASGFSIAHTTVHNLRGQIWMDVLYQKR